MTTISDPPLHADRRDWLAGHCPRLARARAAHRFVLRARAQRHRRKLRQIAELERLVAHRDLQYQRAAVTGRRRRGPRLAPLDLDRDHGNTQAPALQRHLPAPAVTWDDRYVLTNVWLGVSCGQRHFLNRVHTLRETPAYIRFVSAEPLLGPLVAKIADNGVAWWPDGRDTPCVPYDSIELTDIDWLICGGESGTHHRDMNLEWAHDLREVCDLLALAFFMKQDSGRLPGRRGRIPDELWVQQFPRTDEVIA